jgi:hypothetical protein
MSEMACHDTGRYLSFLLEKEFSHQLGNMTMKELKKDPSKLATLNTVLHETSIKCNVPIADLKRKVSQKFYKAKSHHLSQQLDAQTKQGQKPNIEKTTGLKHSSSRKRDEDMPLPPKYVDSLKRNMRRILPRPKVHSASISGRGTPAPTHAFSNTSVCSYPAPYYNPLKHGWRTTRVVDDIEAKVPPPST